MIQYLPYGGFKWIDPGSFNLDNVKADSDIGHILEVDLSYPKELHDAHNEYPYCCEHTTLRETCSRLMLDTSRRNMDSLLGKVVN